MTNNPKIKGQHRQRIHKLQKYQNLICLKNKNNRIRMNYKIITLQILL